MDQNRKIGWPRYTMTDSNNKRGVFDGPSSSTSPKVMENQILWIKSSIPKKRKLEDENTPVQKDQINQDNIKNNARLDTSESSSLNYDLLPSYIKTKTEDSTLTEISDSLFIKIEPSDSPFIRIEHSDSPLINNEPSDLSFIKTESLDLPLIKTEPLNVSTVKTETSNSSTQLNESTQTPPDFINTMPKIECLEENLKTANDYIKMLENVVENKKNALLLKDSADFLNYCEQLLPQNIMLLIKNHLNHEGKPEENINCSKEMIDFALSIYCLSPEVYEIMASMLSLPSVNTIKVYIESQN